MQIHDERKVKRRSRVALVSQGMLVNDLDRLIVHIIHVWKHWNSFTFQLMKHELFRRNEAGGVS